MARLLNPDRGLYSRMNSENRVVWYVRASLNGRMQHFGGFATKTAARQFYERTKARRLEQRLHPGALIPTEYTIPELFGAYLPLAAHRQAYREQQRFAAWWCAHWPHQQVFDLTPADLERARVQLRESGRFDRRSEGTVNHHLKCLRRAMRAIIQPRSWVVDLWSQITLDRPDAIPPAAMNPHDERLIREQLGPEDADKVRLAVLTGLRRTQLFHSRWEQLLWPMKALALPTLKKQRARFLSMPEEALEILKRKWRRAGKPSTGWIFPHPKDGDLPEDPGGWYKYRFKPALERAGLTGKGLTFHSTRHAFAVRFLEAGGHVRQLQKAGGWSSLNQVEIYTQVQDDGLRKAMNDAAKLGRNSRKLQNRNDDRRTKRHKLLK